VNSRSGLLTTIDARDSKWIYLEGKLKGIETSVLGLSRPADEYDLD